MGNTGFIIYNDTEDKGPVSRRGGSFKLGDPRPKWLVHYGNYVELTWMLRRYEEEGDILGVFQVKKELGICEKKLDWWEKRPGFMLDAEVMKGIEGIKKLWGMQGTKIRGR